MLVLAAIAVAHRRENVAAVPGRLQEDLGDAREILADRVGVGVHWRAQFVKINLLEKIKIRGGAFAGSGVTRVIKTGAIWIPCDAASGRAFVDARNFIGKQLAALHVVYVQGAVFASSRGHGERHQAAVERWRVEIDGRFSAGVHCVRVRHHTFRFRIERAVENHQKGLLLGGLSLHREHHAAAITKREVAGRGLVCQRFYAIANLLPAGERGEKCTGAIVLCIAPGSHRGIVVVFKPLVVVLHLHAVVHADHSFLGRRRNGRNLSGKSRRQAAGGREQN